MQVNSVSFAGTSYMPESKKTGGKKAAIAIGATSLVAAALIGGAYIMGKKSPNLANLADSGKIKQFAQTVLEGLKTAKTKIGKVVTSLLDKGKKVAKEVAQKVKNAFEAIKNKIRKPKNIDDVIEDFIEDVE